MTVPAMTAAHTQAPANPLVEFTLFKGAGATPSIKVKNGTLKSGGTWTALCEALTTVKPTEFNPDAINANTRTIAANVAVLTANVDKVEWCNSITATHDNTIEYAAQVAAYNEQVKAYNQSIKSDKSKAKLEPLLTLKLMQHLLKLGTFNNNSRADGNKLATISGLELDYDSGTMPMKEAADLLQAAGVASFLYPSFSATKYVHKWRALVPSPSCHRPPAA